jgi:hypothetical protein
MARRGIMPIRGSIFAAYGLDNTVVERMKTEQSRSSRHDESHVAGGRKVLAPANPLRSTERLDFCIFQT